jgi:O-antigen/teichoic acid export membrane protein
VGAAFFNRKKIPLNFQLLSIASVFRELREGAGMFFSTGWLALQSSLITVVLGQVAGPASVGVYSLADRVRTGAQSIVGPIFQASFPRMASLWSGSENNAQAFLLRLLIVSLGITLTIALVCGFFADRIVLILGGDSYQASAHLLRWMAPIVVLSALTNFFSLQVMVANDRIRAFNLILFWVGLGCVVSVYPMIYWLGAEGAVVLLLLLESALAGSTLVYALRFKLLTRRFNQSAQTNL